VSAAPSAAVLERLRRPRLAGRFPPAEPGVCRGAAGSLDRGRRIELELSIAGDGTVRDARFRAFGCAATLACASWIAERACGATRDELLGLRPFRVEAALDLRAGERASARLALRALRRALEEAG
jgi:nitrogen fixation NifU-like protein